MLPEQLHRFFSFVIIIVVSKLLLLHFFYLIHFSQSVHYRLPNNQRYTLSVVQLHYLLLFLTITVLPDNSYCHVLVIKFQRLLILQEIKSLFYYLGFMFYHWLAIKIKQPLTSAFLCYLNICGVYLFPCI